MTKSFKRVPALDKCFDMLNLLAESGKALGISDMSRSLGYHKSTVFNMVHTLVDLGVLEKESENKFRFGTRLYLLGKAAGNSSQLLVTVHPYLEEINQKTKLSAFLGVRTGLSAVILDKVDSAFDIRISSEIGMRIPLLAGAGGTALLAQLSERDVDEILSTSELKRFTPFSCVSKRKYKQIIDKTRLEGIAIDREEYIEGIRALAVPLRINNGDDPAAIWAVGLKRQLGEREIAENSALLKEIAGKLEARFAF